MVGTPMFHRDSWGPRNAPVHVAATLTPHERRIIAEAMAAGRITVCPPGTAAGLTPIERQFGAARAGLADAAGRIAARDSQLRAGRAMRRREATGSEAGA